MENVRPGDILIYPVAVREKGTVAHYYGCEVVGSISGGKALNMSGEPVTGVMAVYRRKNPDPVARPGRVLLPGRENDSGEMARLGQELEKIYGPGDLVSGFACQCEAACSMLKKRL